MDTSVLNQTLALHRFFVHIARRDTPEAPTQRMWLQRIDEKADGRFVLHTCEPNDPSTQLNLGQVEFGEDIFVTLNEDNEFSLRDTGWTVSNFNLPMPA